MNIKAKYSLRSFTGIYLVTLISTALSYFLIPFDNPRSFNVYEFIIWIIIGNILGLLLGMIFSIFAKRQFLSNDSIYLIYHGTISTQKIEISQIKSIKFDFQHKGSVSIDSENIKISFLANIFQSKELYQLLTNVININQNIIIDEYTKAILSQDVNSWLVREELFMKLIRYSRLMFGYLILIWIILYIINEAYIIFMS